MPAPILLLAGAAALGLVGYAVSKSKGVGTTIVNADGSVNCDVGMPLDTCKAVNVALQVETDPAALRSFASSIPEFPKAASALLSKALTIESLTLTPVKPPASVPDAPPSIAPAVPPAPNTPPPSPPAILPDGPPVAPATPPAPTAPPEPFVQYDPGPLPRLPQIPQSGGTDTASHRSVQAALKNFYDNTNVVDPRTGDNFGFGRSPGDIDGKIGPNTQVALWGFQRYQNANRGMVLTEDGLPGGQTNQVLREWGFDPNASTQTSQTVFFSS